MATKLSESKQHPTSGNQNNITCILQAQKLLKWGRERRPEQQQQQ